MSLKTFRNIIIAGGVAGLTLKAIILTSNDDWDSVTYPIFKLFKKKPEKKPRVVVLGTGWGAMSFLQKVDRDQFDITLVSPRSFFFYTPLLAGTATGTVAQNSIIEPIRHYFDAQTSKPSVYVQGECIGVDPKSKKVTCQIVSAENVTAAGNTVVLDYDYLIVAVGAEVNTFGIPGVKEHTIYMKEIEDGMKVQREILQRLETASALSVIGTEEAVRQMKHLLHWVVIGGGPTGVELTAELTDFILQEVKQYFPHLAPHIRVTLLEATDKLLGMFDVGTSTYARKCLVASGAVVMTNAAVTRITSDTIEMRVKDPVSGEVSVQSLEYGMAVWAGGIATRPLVRNIAETIGSAVQNSRFGLLVDGRLRVKGISDGSIYALGDCAVSGTAPTAQAANQQGKYLGRLFRDTNGQDDVVSQASEFRFVHKGSLAYLGGMKGVAEIRGGFPEFKSFGKLWDHLPASSVSAPGQPQQQQQEGKIRIEGNTAFAIWRSLYFSTILSTRNQLQVLFDWIKVVTFGRSITTPTIVRLNDSSASGGKATIAKPNTPAVAASTVSPGVTRK